MAYFAVNFNSLVISLQQLSYKLLSSYLLALLIYSAFPLSTVVQPMVHSMHRSSDISGMEFQKS